MLIGISNSIVAVMKSSIYFYCTSLFVALVDNDEIKAPVATGYTISSQYIRFSAKMCSMVIPLNGRTLETIGSFLSIITASSIE
jgi:hypothetical protein